MLLFAVDRAKMLTSKSMETKDPEDSGSVEEA